MGHPRLRPGGAKGRRSAAQERYPLHHVAIFGLDPPAISRSQRTPVMETLRDSHCDQLFCPLIQGCTVADERKQPAADIQAQSQRRRMSQPPSVSDCCVAPRQCPIGIAETEKDDPKERL